MNFLRLPIAVCVMLFVSVAVYANNQAAQELDNLLNNLHSLRADFKQTIQTEDDRILQQSAGTMALLRPGKFRWQVESPSKQLIVANGGKLWIYDQDLAQVTVQPVAKTQNTPAFLLSGNNQNLLNRFTIQQLETKKVGINDFLLLPKQNDELFTSLQLTFKGSSLQQIIMKDGLGQITVIKFSNLQLNTNVAEQLFKFHPPAGVDVIDNMPKHSLNT
jgi:outer membrane lipoprotein carrier protein